MSAVMLTVCRFVCFRKPVPERSVWHARSLHILTVYLYWNRLVFQQKTKQKHFNNKRLKNDGFWCDFSAKMPFSRQEAVILIETNEKA